MESKPPLKSRRLALVAVVAVTIGGLALLPVPEPQPSEESVENEESLPILNFASQGWLVATQSVKPKRPHKRRGATPR